MSKRLRKLKKKLRSRPITWRDCAMLAIGVVVTLAGVNLAAYIRSHRVALRSETGRVAIAWLPDPVQRWNDITQEMGKKYNIDPNLLAIIITLESGGNPQAHSSAGADGLMQITGPTAKDIAAKYLKQPRTSYNLQDPRTNIEFGAAYVAHLRDVFGSVKQYPDWTTVELVAAGYNSGPGTAAALERGEGLRDTQPVIYSRDAFNMWRERHAKTSPTFDRWKERGGATLLDAAMGRP